MARLYLTAREYDALLKRQRGTCCVRGCKASEGLIAEHSTPNAIHPGKPDQLMCRPCHKVKTLRDVKAIAKMKRLNGSRRYATAPRRLASDARGGATGVGRWRLKAMLSRRPAEPLDQSR